MDQGANGPHHHAANLRKICFGGAWGGVGGNLGDEDLPNNSIKILVKEIIMMKRTIGIAINILLEQP